MTQNPFDFNGQCCVVTGASQGLGLHMARLLAEHGATVYGISLDGPAVDGSIPASGPGRVVQLQADVTDADSVMDLVAAIEAHGHAIGCWINNAGVGHFGTEAQQDPDMLRRLLDVNAIAPAILGDRVAEHMKGQGVSGSIINVSSVLAHVAMPLAAGYGASKSALEHITRQQARKWARDGIRINALVPGWFETPMTADVLEKGFGAVLKGQIPMRRLGVADDLNGAVLLLASPASKYMTGAALVVDGGLSC